ncbi:prepilin-type N-terminal cleavage/methylation domain-containing protein [Methylomonas methanica]|uniref:General secretion pathway protein J n=1 Tax=Methylomonas methanica (strain DSM 25384 / MC09) TaxID=857087 RepID=G0A042_METMM|nr:prepilin-type N-terminal cleavage/methylation domain-containing protein [Methylomonas methanica]AEG01181.1 general secretion pathway protein J [Methylomonas methanica MC09]
MKPICRNGFTLIEVLIAMTLLGVMVILLFSSLRIAAQSWNAGEHKMAAVNQKAVVYQFFKRHLTAIRPVPMLTTESAYSLDVMPVFQGFPQSIRFAAGLPASSARKGLQIFSIGLDPENSSILLVTLTPYRLTEADQEPVKPEVLLDNIAGLKFAYFGRIEEFAEPQWQEEWAVAERLPSLIRVTIALRDGSYWPDMVFPLKISRAANTQNIADDGQIDDDTGQR